MKYGALGLVEVLGSTNAILVVDHMLKAADVTFKTWNYKCGGHVTVFLSGEVAAVKAAVESVSNNPPCDILNTAVISNPSDETAKWADESAAQNKFA